MRTAAEILSDIYNDYALSNNLKNRLEKALNTARKEVLEEAAARAKAIYDLPNCRVDKQSILTLINELK